VRRSLLGVAAAAAVVASSLVVAPSATADPTADVTGVNLVTSAATIYPHKDGYRDSLKITVSATTDDTSVSTSPGTITITHGTTLIKSWAISGAAPVSETWSGRIHSKIAPGNYVVTASFANADTTVASETAAVGVSRKRLVAHHWSKTIQAGKTTNSCIGLAQCRYTLVSRADAPTVPGGVIHFHVMTGLEYLGDADGVNDPISHGLALPAAIRSSAKATMYVHAHIKVGGPTGHRFFFWGCGYATTYYDYASCGKIRTLKSSTTVSTYKVALGAGTKTADWLVAASNNGNGIVGQYTVHVEYYTLK
jgi:hypothetical protein